MTALSAKFVRIYPPKKFGSFLLCGGNTPLEGEPRILRIVMEGVASTQFVAFAEAILFRGAGIGLVYRDYLAVAVA